VRRKGGPLYKAGGRFRVGPARATRPNASRRKAPVSSKDLLTLEGMNQKTFSP